MARPASVTRSPKPEPSSDQPRIARRPRPPAEAGFRLTRGAATRSPRRGCYGPGGALATNPLPRTRGRARRRACHLQGVRMLEIGQRRRVEAAAPAPEDEFRQWPWRRLCALELLL